MSGCNATINTWEESEDVVAATLPAVPVDAAVVRREDGWHPLDLRTHTCQEDFPNDSVSHVIPLAMTWSDDAHGATAHVPQLVDDDEFSEALAAYQDAHDSDVDRPALMAALEAAARHREGQQP